MKCTVLLAPYLYQLLVESMLTILNNGATVSPTNCGSTRSQYTYMCDGRAAYMSAGLIDFLLVIKSVSLGSKPSTRANEVHNSTCDTSKLGYISTICVALAYENVTYFNNSVSRFIVRSRSSMFL